MELIIWQSLFVAVLMLLAISVFYIAKMKKKMQTLAAYDEKLQDELLKYALANPNPVFGMDKSGHVIFSNHGAESILQSWKTALFDKIPPEWREIAKQVALSGKAQTVELKIEHQYFLLSIVPRRDGSFSFFGMEITDLKALEKELENRILNDEHTTLPNRVSFRQSLERHVKVAVSAGTKLGLCIIRLDDYYQILNSYGEETAKALILAFSERLTQFVHHGSNISRLNENQFALLEANIVDPAAMAIHIKELIDTCGTSYRIHNRDIYLVLSVGIAFCPNDGTTAEVLTRNAQLAVNRTSRTRNAYEFFQRGMEEQLQLRRDIIADLRVAITENQFELFYQPQIDITKQELVGCEALVRWKHPTKGYIAPAYFITTAEESNLIEQIGDWTIKEACRQISEWRHQGFSPFRVSINISGRQILKTDIIHSIQEMLNETQIPVEWFSLELTETALVQDKDRAQEVLRGLKNLGLEVSLDDFGIGYSSLSYLAQFPIDKIKLDHSFVRPIENENEEYVVTKGIIELAHKMDLHVIAEGVETPTQLKYMQKHHCEIIQGYIFGKPIDGKKFVEYLQTDWKHEIDKYLKD